MSENFASQIYSLGETSNHFHFQNTATSVFSHFNGTRMNVLRHSPFTDLMNQFQNVSTVRNKPNRSNDQKYMLNTEITTVPTFSRTPLSPVYFGVNCCLSSRNKNPFQTKTKLNATVNQC